MLAALLCAVLAVPALAASIQLPPVNDPPTGEHHPGKPVFVELVTPDLAASKKFYGGLFGWKFRAVSGDGVEYAEATHNGRPVGGLLHRDLPAGSAHRPAWLSFFATGDVDAAVSTAQANGAKLLYGPLDAPDRGREAVMADPQGAVFAMLASSSGDPADELADTGEWIWSSLITTDPDDDAAFYQKLFDYEVYELPPGKSTHHLLLATDDYARASVNTLPAAKPGMHPHWLNFVRVKNAGKMAARAAKLGGRVLVEPRLDRHGGKLAVVADPQGAVFGLLEWPDRESKEVPQ
jgi:predicted enzyme related to lactoylglutathione lyase